MPLPAAAVPALATGLLRILATGGRVAKNVPRGDPRLLQGGMRNAGSGSTGAPPAYAPAYCAYKHATSQRRASSRTKPVPDWSVRGARA
jgi:hypothetical protein